MLDSKSATPPPLDSPSISERGRESTAESTPITTPTSATATSFHQVSRAKRGKDLWHSWHRKPSSPASAFIDSDVLFEDSGDSSFPLFDDTPALGAAGGMDGAAHPIDITTPPRFNSQSPRNQQSNLTFALQEANAQGGHASAAPVQAPNGSDGRPGMSGRQPSIGNGMNSSSYYNRSAINIPAGRDKSRRESNTGASSFINGGMSWGGVSVGSWVRDDLLMTGTSPYAFHQSPSFHSSSYLPKMEANFLQQFECCGIQLDSLHELLTHYEINHANASNIIGQGATQQMQNANGRQSSGIGGQAAGMQNSQQYGMGQSQMPMQRSQQPQNSRLQTLPDVDELGDMEMDEATAPMTPMQQNFNYQPQSQTFNHQQQPQLQPLNMNLANTMQNHHGMRSTTPTTPSANFNFANNPTVSSVNTPALSTNQLPGGMSQKSPETSMPGTPLADFDPNNFQFDPTTMPLMPDMNLMMQNPNFDWASAGGQNFGGLPNDMSGLTIDDPAKHLFSKQGATGGNMSTQQMQYLLRTGQLGDNTELSKAVQQQLQTRLNGFGMEQENKPFKCPVIGCEKAYKNQNGLKYHKQHGHQNQQLKENGDGTFSIVDPLTSAPYPGTMGMEKEKPYRCEVCGKRYKNLNGLKYHRQHSPPCNPDLKINMPNLAGLNVNVNVAGAGLPVGDLAGVPGVGGGIGGGGGGFGGGGMGGF